MSARKLTQKGHKQLQQGEGQKALNTWSEAYKIYQQLNNSDGETGSLINQSLALQSLGLYTRSCETLITALKLEDKTWICSGNQTKVKQQQELMNALQKQSRGKTQILGLKNLGNVLRLIGKPEISEIVLKEALVISKSFSKELQNSLLLSLANTERTSYQKASNKYQITEEPVGKKEALNQAESRFIQALNYYQQVKSTGNKKSDTELLAQLNQLDLLLEQFFKKKSVIFDNLKISNNQQSIYDLTKKLLVANFGKLQTNKSIYASTQFSDILIKIAANEDLSRIFTNEKINLYNAALNIGLSALDKTNNKRAESFTKGTVGKIYDNLGQLEKSEIYLEEALGLAQSVRAWDIAYQWQQELARLYQKLGKFDRANKAYDAAIKSIEQVQSSSLSANPEFKFNFKDRIEAVYKQYLNLLLSREKPNFNQIIQVKQKLQLAEIKNFLQCNYLPTFEKEVYTNDTNNSKVLPIIYIFQIKNQVEIIIKTKDNLFFRHTANFSEITSGIDDLINLLQSPDFLTISESRFLTYSQNIYDLLVLPIKKYLPDEGELVFVLDTYFQNVPFSLLHDGERYLLEDYAITVSLTSKTAPLVTENLKVLVAGLSQANTNLKHPLFPGNITPLPEVNTEISYIRNNTTEVIELINAGFTSNNFQESMVKRRKDFPLIHISTHGQFSSDPHKTFILAWDKPINVREFENLLKNNPSPIDLLVLSACQTAKGDKRSALGIAGMAAMVGAQNTLATLWLVNAKSTSELMGDFYKNLNNGLNKAQALRQAQLALLKNPKYSHPYYWSPFILVSK
ncbi:hypothetical protein BC008_13920 [Mastigocoleus testarum BC008]|uniref:CHAT domain-containing protein n=1 Tax=Mastigocoleus testarum BC008 TaxID=371196 RepID=A0A0V7ZG39_9CYAN|nr:hypothetical protein BC008_13920 [Mastigocoleus testarum BC008]